MGGPSFVPALREPPLSRRRFLRATGAASLALSGLARLGAGASASAADPEAGFGELVADPERLLDLPRGFTYAVLSRVGEKMADGLVVPAAPDGMAAFPGPAGKTLLVRNHELGNTPAAAGPFGPHNALLADVPRDRLYDAGRAGEPCLGGTTTLVVDTRARRLESQHLSLAGTLRNCAGGATPWGTWLTCEEATERAEGAYARDHGFNFEVVPSPTPGLVEPAALRAMGRFMHEAAAVDPASGCVYQSEDRPDGLLYRFVPARARQLAAGGRLQALAVRDKPSLDTRNWDARDVPPGTSLAVAWIELDQVESPKDDLRKRGWAKGAARFARGEGLAWGAAGLFVACTSGGPSQLGQIWRYVPSPREGTPEEAKEPGRLELFLEPADASVVDHPDNLAIAPWGDLVACEDGMGEQLLLGVTPGGRVYKLARNARDQSEFAGATFSPDATMLFVNLQKTGLTLAITGPWPGRRA